MVLVIRSRGCISQIEGTTDHDDVLVHFNPEFELVLACDTSPYGVGAVLTHKMPDGSENRLPLCQEH